MRCARGLTLLETLAATVLLAAVAAAMVPMLRGASAAAQQRDPLDLASLSRAADAVIDDPQGFGIERLDAVMIVEIPASLLASLAGASGHEHGPLIVQRLVSPGDTDHNWLLFYRAGAEGAFIARWIESHTAEEDDS